MSISPVAVRPVRARRPGRLVRPRRRQLYAGVGFRQAGIDHVDLAADRVYFDDGTALGYDMLVIATGCPAC
jgi:sulfide:quinone oxidoreductase